MSRRLLPALGWASAFLFALALHLQGILSHRWNSDEPQHLHVVRGWAVGLLPYRDVFDNHAPLFSFLCSPLFRLFGETPRIVELMRLAMVPLFLLTLWCIFCLGRALVSVRAGLWGSLFASLWPSWSVKMIEFRADILWTALWLLALTLLLTGRMNRQRAFLAGLAFGACFSTSLKTTLLLANLLAAGSAALLYLGRNRTPAQPFPTREILRLGGCFLAGMCVLPAAWIAFFSVTGNLSAFRYCLITHNLVPKAEKTVRHYKRAAWIATVAVMVLLAARVPLARWIPDRGKQTRLLLLLFLNVSFYPLLRGLWTMITPQDFLPISPIFALSTGLVCAALTRERGRFLPFAVAAGLAVLLVRENPPDRRPNRSRVEELAALLRLSRPGEFVMDAKGENIFRTRPYYYAVETFTRQRLAAGILPDILPERLVETGTAIVYPSPLFPPRGKKFIAQNYLPIGPFSVLGQELEGTGEGGRRQVEIAVTGEYSLIVGGRVVSGMLDGVLMTGSRQLTAGMHELVMDKTAAKPALLWSRAVEAGFRPQPSSR